jgi:hypothetical protein
MKFRSLFVVASVAALCACNKAPTNTATANTAAPAAPAATGPAATPAPAAPAAGGTADAATMQQLNLAAQAIQSQVPIVQGPTTITAARVEGSTLVTAMTLAAPLSTEMTSQMGTQLSGQVCQNPALGQLSRAGASFAYEITDSNGQVHRVDVAPC